MSRPMNNVRAWDDVLQRMLYAKFEQYDDMIGYRFDAHFDTEEPVYMWGTGLQDRNGKEIYEGDVVTVSNFMVETQPTYRAVVEWDKYRFALCNLDKPDNIFSFPMRNLDPFGLSLQIVGNKFDHPHLLKGDDSK